MGSRDGRLRQFLGPDWVTAYVLVAPMVLLLGGLIAYPFFRAVYLSFTRSRGPALGQFVGLANYRFLWTDRFFRQAVWVTLLLTLGSGVAKLLLSLVAALALHRLGRRADIWAGLMLLPWIMPTVVRAITWRGLLDPLYGSVNRILLDLDIIDKAIPFLGGLSTALPSVILVDVWQGLPFFVINILAGLKGTDVELYEAAAIDGASAWRRFLHITLPSLRYILVVVNLLATIWTFNSFELIQLLTAGGPMNATRVYSVLAYAYAVRGRQFGLATAVALSVAPVFILAIALLAQQLMSGPRTSTAPAIEPQPQSGHWPRPALRWVRDASHDVVWWANTTIEDTVALGLRAPRWLLRRVGGAPHGTRALRRLSAVAAWAALAVLLVFELGPFYWVVTTAFKSELQITRWTSVLWPRPWCLDQFRTLLGPQGRFLLWLLNTLTLAVVSPLISTALAALSAYALTRLRWRGARALANSVLVSYLMPGVLLVIPIYELFGKLGLLNTHLSLVISYPSFTLPFAVWLLMGYFVSIPSEIEDAALVDGCSRLQAFWRIVMPLTKPALAATLLFGVTQVWNEYLFAATLLMSESKMTIALGLAQMIWGDVTPWGRLCAAATLMSVPVLGLYTVGQRFMVAGLTAGALKGGG